MGESKKKKKKEKRKSLVEGTTEVEGGKSSKKRKVAFPKSRDVLDGFEEVDAPPLLAGLKADSKHCELWLLQVPAEIEELTDMNGATMDVAESGGVGIVGSLQNKGGESFHVIQENEDAASQTIVDAMVPETFPAKVPIRKRVTLVRNWQASEEGAANRGAKDELSDENGKESIAHEGPVVAEDPTVKVKVEEGLEVKVEEGLEGTPLQTQTQEKVRKKSKAPRTPEAAATPKTPKSAKSSKEKKKKKAKEKEKQKSSSKKNVTKS